MDRHASATAWGVIGIYFMAMAALADPPQFTGADAVIEQALKRGKAAEQEGPGADPSARLEKELLDFSKQSPKLPPDEAAKTWVELW